MATPVVQAFAYESQQPLPAPPADVVAIQAGVCAFIKKRFHLEARWQRRRVGADLGRLEPPALLAESLLLPSHNRTLGQTNETK